MARATKFHASRAFDLRTGAPTGSAVSFCLTYLYYVRYSDYSTYARRLTPSLGSYCPHKLTVVIRMVCQTIRGFPGSQRQGVDHAFRLCQRPAVYGSRDFVL